VQSTLTLFNPPCVNKKKREKRGEKEKKKFSAPKKTDFTKKGRWTRVG